MLEATRIDAAAGRAIPKAKSRVAKSAKPTSLKHDLKDASEDSIEELMASLRAESALSLA